MLGLFVSRLIGIWFDEVDSVLVRVRSFVFRFRVDLTDARRRAVLSEVSRLAVVVIGRISS